MNGRHEASDRELFDAIADRYSAKDLAPSSRPARRCRLERTIEGVPDRNFDRVLEVGCGAGFGAEYLRGRFNHYVGIDHSRRLIEAARERIPLENVHFEATSIDQFNPRSPFDLIFMIGVLHHLEDASRALEKMVSWLRPGGYLVANEPQPGNPMVHVARRVRARRDTSYSSEQVELDARQLRSMLEGAGIEGIEISAQGFLSTPFAEVVLKPYCIMAPLARAACTADGWLEKAHPSWTQRLSWNLIVRGKLGHAAEG